MRVGAFKAASYERRSREAAGAPTAMCLPVSAPPSAAVRHLILAAGAIAFAADAAGQSAAGWGEAKVERTVIETGLTARVEEIGWSSTRNGCRIARVEFDRSAHSKVTIDGEVVGTYDLASGPVFSPDGTSYAFKARRVFDEFYVVDGAEGPACDKVFAIEFSDDGSRHGYLAGQGGKPVVVVDGKVQPLAQGMIPAGSPPTFAPDGTAVAWIEMEATRTTTGEGQMRIVRDGKQGKLHHGVSLLRAFSPSGNRFAYGATDGDKWFFVIDGKADPPFDQLGIDFVFSPDGRRYAYFGQTGEKYILMVDGKPVSTVPGMVDHQITFSPDGSRLAYAFLVGDGTAAMVVDGSTGPAHDELGAPPAPPNLDAKPPVTAAFSPDGNHFAYVGRRAGSYRLVVDGTEQKPRWDTFVGAFGLGGTQTHAAQATPGGIIFSPDSRRVAIVGGRSDGQHVVIVDGKTHPPYPGVTRPSFSPDGLHLAYAAVVDDAMAVIVDGLERARLKRMAVPPVFRDDHTLEFVVREDDTLVRIEVSALP